MLNTRGKHECLVYIPKHSPEENTTQFQLLWTKYYMNVLLSSDGGTTNMVLAYN